ncbi:MAG: hypothetical protein ACR2IK_20115 [Chloroflexota bacterium]
MHTSNRPDDDHLVGAEIVFGRTPIGQVDGVIRDPLSGRVRKVITTYGPAHRRVAVPMEWVVRRTSTRLVLGVGPVSLDDLADQADIRATSTTVV